MKASELRIGNLILANGKTITVESVDEYGINLEADYYGGDVISTSLEREYELEDLNGIELTEEWLLKLGLDKQNHFKEWKVDNKYSVFLYEGNYRLQAETVLGSYTVARVIYIHQLQNLYYALTGEELTIKE